MTPLAGLPVSAAQREALVDNLGSSSAAGVLRSLDPAVAQQVQQAADDAFIHALSSGMWLSAGVAAVGAVIALVCIAPLRSTQPDAAERPAAAGEAGAVSA